MISPNLSISVPTHVLKDAKAHHLPQPRKAAASRRLRHDSYQGAPTDGSAWTSGPCDRRVARGGGLGSHPRFLRAAARFRLRPDFRFYSYGFRLARTLSP